MSQADRLRAWMNKMVVPPKVPGLEHITSDPTFNAEHIKWAKNDIKCSAIQLFNFNEATPVEQAEFYQYSKECVDELKQLNTKLETDIFKLQAIPSRSIPLSGCTIM